MTYSPLLNQLIAALECLPGVGPKSAQRMAFHLLHRDRTGAENLAQALQTAVHKIGHCKRCRMFSENEECSICESPRRNSRLLCVVESPADVEAIEQSSAYDGMYFVLMGHLSPLDGIGPDALGIPLIEQRLVADDIDEVILATNPTVEGDATAHYLAELAGRRDIRTTRIAYGVPIGGELEYVDVGTLAHAFAGRQSFS